MLIMLNVRNRDYADIYDNEKAFYDLNRQRHSRYLELLEKGETCCVVSYEDKKNKQGKVKLDYWKYREYAKSTKFKSWYMLGTRGKAKSGLMTKAQLRRNKQFRDCFNVDGNFKRFCIRTTNA